MRCLRDLNYAQNVDVYATSCIPPRPQARAMQVGVMHSATILDAPTRSLQNIEDKQAHEPANKGATPCGIHVWPLLHRSSRKHLIFKKIYVYARCFVPGYGAKYVIKMLILWSSQRDFFTLRHR